MLDPMIVIWQRDMSQSRIVFNLVVHRQALSSGRKRVHFYANFYQEKNTQPPLRNPSTLNHAERAFAADIETTWTLISQADKSDIFTIQPASTLWPDPAQLAPMTSSFIHS